MKRISCFLCIALILAGGIFVGCALVQKPPASADEKTAWIQSSLDGLEDVALGENLALIAFNGFCYPGAIDDETCALGNELDAAWQKSYLAAKDGLEKYGRNEITQKQAQILLDTAMIKSLKEVMDFLKKRSAGPAKEKAIKLRGGDLLLPSGEKKLKK